jgi:hypothetical protein
MRKGLYALWRNVQGELTRSEWSRTGPVDASSDPSLHQIDRSGEAFFIRLVRYELVQVLLENSLRRKQRIIRAMKHNGTSM